MKVRDLLYRKSNIAGLLMTLIPAVTVGQTGPNAYVQQNLVSGRTGPGGDHRFASGDPWGMSQTATSPFWVSNHDTGTSTLL